MAKRTKKVKAMVVAVPSARPVARSRARRAAKPAGVVRQTDLQVIGGSARRGARSAVDLTWKGRESIAMVGGAGIVGYLDGAGHLDFIPDLIPGADAVGRLPTLAIAAYGIGALAKSRRLKAAGIGLAAAAALGYGLDQGRKAKEAKAEPEPAK